MMRKNGILLSAVVMLAITSAASASNYRSEITISGNTSKFEDTRAGLSENIKNTVEIFSGTYYFEDVTTGSLPLAEAAFLERTSSVSLIYLRDHFRINGKVGNGSLINEYRHSRPSTMRAINLDFYFPNSIFYLSGSITKASTESRTVAIIDEESFPAYGGEAEHTSWGLRAGITPVNGLLIWSEFYEDQKVNDQWNINIKYIADLNGNAINLEASYDRAYAHYLLAYPNYGRAFAKDNFDGITRSALAADYYFDQTFSLGVIYNHYDFSYSDNDYGLRLHKFFTGKFAVEASFMTSDSSRYDSDGHYQVGATLRF